MIRAIWLFLLIALPLLESVNRQAGYVLLLVSSGAVSLHLLKRRIILDSLDLLFGVFLVWSAVTTLFSASLNRSFTEYLRYGAYFILYIALKNTLSQKRCVYFVAKSVIFASIVLTALAVAATVPRLATFVGQIPHVPGMNFFYTDFGHNRISEILIFSIPLCFGLNAMESGLRKKIYGFLAIVLSMMLFYSFSRGALIALVLSGYIVYIYRLRYAAHTNTQFLKRWIKPLGIVAFIFLSISFLYANIVVNPQVFGNTPRGVYKPIIFEKRLHYWQQASRAVIENPLLGTGLDTFRYTSVRSQAKPVHWSWFTHNHILQLFSEIGIVGGTLFALFIAFLIHYGFKELIVQRGANEIRWGAFIGIIASTLHSFIDYGWQFLSILLIVFALSASLIALKRKVLVVPKGALYAVVILFVYLVVIRLVIPYESELLVAYAKSEMNSGKIRNASTTLLYANVLDRANPYIYKELGKLMEVQKDTKKAHYYYDEVLKRNPHESFEVARSDFKLYLSDARDALGNGDVQKSAFLINEANLRYPYVHKEIHHATYFVDYKDVKKAFERNAAAGIIDEYINNSFSKIDTIYAN